MLYCMLYSIFLNISAFQMHLTDRPMHLTGRPMHLTGRPMRLVSSLSSSSMSSATELLIDPFHLFYSLLISKQIDYPLMGSFCILLS